MECCSLLSYVLFFVLAYIVWFLVTKCMSGSDQGDHGGGGTGEGGGDEGDGGGDETDHPSVRHDNLLKNNCGQDQYRHWKIEVNHGDGWIIEKTPVGTDKLPKSTKDGERITDFGDEESCFATSYDLCLKNQLIDLVAEGYTQEFLDRQPPIEVSEWFAYHEDCPGKYMINVTLLNQEKANMASFLGMEGLENVPRKMWHQVSHKFTGYGTGLRYISFNHGGQSSEKRDGHYGAKMSGGVVRVLKE